MSKYNGLFTFDVDNHRYLPIEQADGLVSDMFYNPETEEEPKEFWYVNDMGGVEKFPPNLLDREAMVESHKKIGNYFETKEEAEKAVEKLKAWKRLKDKGFKFEWWLSEPSSDHIEFYMDSFEWDKEATKDLNLLFESGDLEAKNE